MKGKVAATYFIVHFRRFGQESQSERSDAPRSAGIGLSMWRTVAGAKGPDGVTDCDAPSITPALAIGSIPRPCVTPEQAQSGPPPAPPDGPRGQASARTSDSGRFRKGGFQAIRSVSRRSRDLCRRAGWCAVRMQPKMERLPPKASSCVSIPLANKNVRPLTTEDYRLRTRRTLQAGSA